MKRLIYQSIYVGTMRRFLLVMVLLMAAISCTSGGGEQSGIKIDNDFRKGTDGLTMRFLPDLPPTTVFNTHPLTVMIEYRNSGAYTIDQGNIYLSGYDSNYLNFGSSQHSITGLEGKSITNPNGIYREIAEFTASSVDVQNIENIDSFSQIIRGTACYIYHTDAYPIVCMDPTAGRGTSNQKICTVHSVSLSGGQGAPVAVTNVEQEMAGNRNGGARVIFKIGIKNMGKGTVFSASRGVSNCHTDLSYTDVDVVDVDSVSFSGTQMDCRPSQVRLDNGVGTIICMADGSFGNGVDAYTTPLEISLAYGYRESIERSVNIVNLE